MVQTGPLLMKRLQEFLVSRRDTTQLRLMSRTMRWTHSSQCQWKWQLRALLGCLVKTLRYQPGLKKANFWNFRFRDVQIKPFKSFLLKKVPQKKLYFSAKLLALQVYYTLIVLITRWQVLAFWNNFVCQHVTKQITRYSGVILSRNLCCKIGWNAFEKKKRSCPFSSATARQRKPKNRLARIGLKT